MVNVYLKFYTHSQFNPKNNANITDESTTIRRCLYVGESTSKKNYEVKLLK